MRYMGLGLAAALALAACATGGEQTTASATSGGSDCFRSEQVRGFSVIDNRHVGISVGASRQYVLTTAFNSSDLDWSNAVAIRTTTGRICTGNGLGVELIGGDPPRNYPIVSIARAPEDQAAQGS